MLNPTAPDQLVDEQGRPYFLRDGEMTLEQFVCALAAGDPQAFAVLLTEARPDDVFSFVSLERIVEVWPEIEMHVEPHGQWEFWNWLLGEWESEVP